MDEGACQCHLSNVDLDENQDLAVSSPKRQKESEERSKYSGAFKYKTKFNKEWTKSWPFIAAVQGDPYSARCNVCAKMVNITHHGAADIRSHVWSQAHSKLAKVVVTQPKLSFTALSSPLADKVCQRSILLNFLIHMDFPSYRSLEQK